MVYLISKIVKKYSWHSQAVFLKIGYECRNHAIEPFHNATLE